MHVSVNGVRLFFDVEGAKFVRRPVMREKPVLLMLRVFRPSPSGPEARDA